MTMDIREFLEARLADDERMAREACDGDSGRWFMGDKWNVYRSEDEAPWEDFEENKLVTWGNVKSQSEFIARHDPARVLRDVEAKRRIPAAYVDDDRLRFGDWETCSDSCPVQVLDEVVKLLALPYSDHPDYDPSWSPENVVPHV